MPITKWFCPSCQAEVPLGKWATLWAVETWDGWAKDWRVESLDHVAFNRNSARLIMKNSKSVFPMRVVRFVRDHANR